MNNKQLEELRKRFILPSEEHEIINRVKNCLKNGIKIIRFDKDNKNVEVFFERTFSKKKREYWEEYALCTYKLLKDTKRKLKRGER